MKRVSGSLADKALAHYSGQTKDDTTLTLMVLLDIFDEGANVKLNGMAFRGAAEILSGGIIKTKRDEEVN